MLTITLAAELEQGALAEAKRRGIPVQDLTAEALRAHLAAISESRTPASAHDWQQKLAAIGVDCGVSLPDEALASEALYD